MASKDSELVEVKAGIHIDLIDASVRGVKISGGKLEILGLHVDFADFHGDMQALEDLGAEGFQATVTIEGRIMREKIPSGQKVPDGQTTLEDAAKGQIPDADDEESSS